MDEELKESPKISHSETMASIFIIYMLDNNLREIIVRPLSEEHNRIVDFNIQSGIDEKGIFVKMTLQVED